MSRYCDGDDDVGGSVVLVPEPPPTFLLLRVFAAWRVNPKRGVGDEEALAFGVNRSKVLPDVIGCAAVPSGGWISPAAPSSAIVTRVGIALAGRLFYNVLLDAMPIQSLMPPPGGTEVFVLAFFLASSGQHWRQARPGRLAVGK